MTVNFYLKVIIAINQDTNVLYIVTFSKFVLVLAIIKLLYKKNN